MGKKIDIDQAVVMQIKNGNKLAFDGLFKRYGQKLYFFAFGYLKSEDEAREVVQNTFIKIWERRADLDASLSMHAYIFTIAYNFIKKQLIKKVKDEKLRHELSAELTDFDDNTSHKINYHFLLERIEKLILELPPRQREILKLRKLDGYSVVEISDMLSLAPKTVEAHLTASLKALKAKLQIDQLGDLLLFVFVFKKNL